MTGDELQRQRARRNRWTVTVLTLVALGFYIGFFIKMRYDKPAALRTDSAAQTAQNGH